MYWQSFGRPRSMQSGSSGRADHAVSWVVQRAWLDGSNRQTVAEFHAGSCTVMLDRQKQQLYVQLDGQLKRMHVNGSGLEVRAQGVDVRLGRPT